jgi:hypothetical protein
MKLLVRELTGKEFEIEVDPDDPVETLKDKITLRMGYPQDTQRFIFSGRGRGSGDYTLSFKSYGITEDNVVHLVRRLRAGAKQNQTFEDLQ